MRIISHFKTGNIWWRSSENEKRFHSHKSVSFKGTIAGGTKEEGKIWVSEEIAMPFFVF
jgi:hypothetical protein